MKGKSLSSIEYPVSSIELLTPQSETGNPPEGWESVGQIRNDLAPCPMPYAFINPHSTFRNPKSLGSMPYAVFDKPLTIRNRFPISKPVLLLRARSSARIERRTSNPQVAGSNPAGRAIFSGHSELSNTSSVGPLAQLGRATDS